MNNFFQLTGVIGLAFLLGGCPDSGLPKSPPKVPEPKAANAVLLPLAMLKTDNKLTTAKPDRFVL